MRNQRTRIPARLPSLSRLIFCLGPLVIVAAATSASGQYPSDVYGGYHGGSTVYRHSSTVAEGSLRGMGDLVRSAGQANLLSSQAAINLEEARSRALDNRLKFAETYFERRRINDEYRRYNARQTTPEQIQRISQLKMPERLGSSRLDPVSGEIRWPAALTQVDFDREREQIEEIFAERAIESGYLTGAAQLEALQLAAEMEDKLLLQVEDLPPQAYTEAKSFLRSLAFEARFAMN